MSTSARKNGRELYIECSQGDERFLVNGPMLSATLILWRFGNMSNRGLDKNERCDVSRSSLFNELVISVQSPDTPFCDSSRVLLRDRPQMCPIDDCFGWKA